MTKEQKKEAELNMSVNNLHKAIAALDPEDRVDAKIIKKITKRPVITAENMNQVSLTAQSARQDMTMLQSFSRQLTRLGRQMRPSQMASRSSEVQPEVPRDGDA